jgi:hypothetical protein
LPYYLSENRQLILFPKKRKVQNISSYLFGYLCFIIVANGGGMHSAGFEALTCRVTAGFINELQMKQAQHPALRMTAC